MLSAITALAGCGGGAEHVVTDAVPEIVEGQITKLEQANGTISAFDIRRGDGKRYRIYIAADVKYGFDLDHLEEHLEESAPVRCVTEERADGRSYAVRIDDA